mmetsp:Transcript_7591/g.12905  ORF Transcript_7591/g.12905 Transcript_7591/m.12905 type:complete len:96 (+) Transcript_7591:545-832(+)
MIQQHQLLSCSELLFNTSARQASIRHRHDALPMCPSFDCTSILAALSMKQRTAATAATILRHALTLHYYYHPQSQSNPAPPTTRHNHHGQTHRVK